MFFLIFTIAFSVFNHLLFRAFSRWRIDLLTAIVTNYAVCVVIGYGSSIGSIARPFIFGQDWYPYSVLQGGLLVAAFFLMGRTTTKQGVATTSLAMRLSVAIPTVLAFFLYEDPITILKVIGITAAFLALYLSVVEDPEATYSRRAINWLPGTLFIAFGLNSTLIKFVQAKLLEHTSYHTYVMASFLAAFIISGLVLVGRIFKRQHAGRWQDLISGLVLGCSNYGAVYFLLSALGVPGWQSSRIFPTISIAVVSISSLGAWVIFNERPRRRLLGAIIIGLGAIILINL